MRKLMDEDEEIDGKIDQRGEGMTSLPLSLFWLKEI
jgi:hypothetical protein